MLSFTTNGNFIDFKYTEDQYPNYVHLLVKLHNTSRAISWSYSDDTTRISFWVDELYYDDVLISSIYFDGVQMTAQADFETGIEAMFPGYAGGGAVASYKVYTALLDQTGTADPVATILENTLAGTPVFDRDVAGIYNITCPGETFPEAKTTLSIQPNFNWYNYFLNSLGGTLQIGTYSDPTTPADDQLVMTMIEIRVYP